VLNMSRRRGEFEHRTSIFEGAYRAWSHLGGLDAEELETKSATDLDPLTNPIFHDSRHSSNGFDSATNPDGSKRREYPYEPLPRSGLSHPYVQAILTPWLGPEADNEAIQLGLTTLRTWWQHRRKGESGSAIAALGTEKMKGVVEGYTRHFFTLAHCLVVNEKVQPPRGLHGRMKELEKQRNKRAKKKGRDDGSSGANFLSFTAPSAVNVIRADLTNPNLTPLEQLHFAQQHQMEYSQVITRPVSLNMKGILNSDIDNHAPNIDTTGGQGIPGNIDLPSAVNDVQMNADRMKDEGVLVTSNFVPSTVEVNSNAEYGDPNSTPVVFVSSNGDIQIGMKVDGITCSHCVKIVETVLRGHSGNRSPINGLLDAAADRDLRSLIIKIDKASNAKRIAFEAKRNLAMVGYTAHPKMMSIVDQSADKKVTMDLGALSTAFEVVANTDSQDMFDWKIPCTCPDNGMLSTDCKR
jgi:copper chaperone CopZ